MVKPIDSWWTVIFVDPVVTRIVPFLVRFPALTPIRITLVSHVLGLLAVGAFANGWLLAGAALFEVRFMIDCMDGKVARLTGQTSTTGQVLDAFGDRLLVTASLAALGWAVDPVAGLIAAGAYPLSHHLLEERDQMLLRAGRRKRSDVVRSDGFGAAMARRRLYPIPTSIEFEHLGLFMGPAVAAVTSESVARVVLYVVAAFFVGQCARYFLGLLRAAQSVDRSDDRVIE